MKKVCKIWYITLIAVIILSLFSSAFAANEKNVLNVVEGSSGIKYLENDQGYISKTIVDSNSDTGEVTIELKISNTKKETETSKIYDNTEIYILVPENLSNDSEKLATYTGYIEKLANNIFNKNSNTKIGIIGMKGTISDSTTDENGNMIWGENDEGEVKGTEENAEIVTELTNSVQTIKNGLNSMNTGKLKYHHNLQAAVRLANKSYSNETNKILISLYDGVPDIAIGVCKTTEYGGMFSEYRTPEEAVIGKHKEIVKNTKDEILKLKASNISFIQLRPDDTSYDETWYSLTTGEKMLDFDGSPYVQELYGTIENPVYGKMYSLNNETLENIVTKDIYKNIMEIIQTDINTVKVVDYFPGDIMENFTFSYVGDPSIGTVSGEIDEDNSTIEWNIETLKGNEVATLRYKLKIKDMDTAHLLNKTISTNEKVVLTYKDADNKDYTVTLENSPKIKLEKKEQPNNDKEKPATGNTINTEKDPTVAPGVLPKTGVSYGVVFSIIGVTLIAIFIFAKIREYKDIK